MNEVLSSHKLPCIGIVNLGCSRNTVDSQIILGRLQNLGYPIVDAAHCDIAIVNTCGFIKDAKEESIDAIWDLVDLKKRGKVNKIIVSGCLAERYAKELKEEIPEIDAIVGVLSLDPKKNFPQLALTPAHYAYVKICESCYNQCTFCIIPKIKGKFVSRSFEAVLQEIQMLDKQNVKEINIIGQDITAYGMDLYGKKSLAPLLKKILSLTKNIRWIRLLYTFPAHITDELINLVAKEKRICPYVDIPLQHISDKMLTMMNRRMNKKQTIALIRKIRKRIPNVALRSTFVVGLPGETKKDFQELLDFIGQMPFERAGVFMYSREEGTPAYDFPHQVSFKVKQQRFKILMKKQQEISCNLLKRFLNSKLKVLIEEKKKDEDNIYVGRSPYDAPEVDGVVYVRSSKPLKAGDFALVRVVDTLEYDLVAEAL